MKKTTLALVIATALISSSAFAATPNATKRTTTVTTEANGATTTTTTTVVTTNNSNSSSDSSNNSNNAISNAVAPNRGAGAYVGINTILLIVDSINGGYMFNQYFGIEAGYMALIYEPSYGVAYAALKGVAHLSPSSIISVYGKIGGGQAMFGVTDNDTQGNNVEMVKYPEGIMFDVGLGFDTGTNTTIMTGVSGFSDKDHNLYAPYFGFAYHF